MNLDDHNFFVDLVVGYRKAKTVFAAHALGVFAALDSHAMSATVLATKLGCDEQATLILLRGLVSVGLLSHDAGIFANTERAARHLVPGRAGYAGNNLAFQNQIWPLWGELEQTVKEGHPSAPLLGLLGDQDQSFTREYVKGMDIIAARPAAVIAELLGRTRPPLRILDVGAGPGTYARAILSANEDARATLFDLPTTLTVTEELWADSPLRARMTPKAGDYTKDAFGENAHDLVLLSHVTHNESPTTNALMLRKAHDALEPKGRVAIHDFVVNDDGCGPTFSALFSINMLVYTNGGRTYSRGEYTEMLRAAGFRNIVVHEMAAGAIDNPTALIVGEKSN